MPIEKDGKIMLTLSDLKPMVDGNAIIDGTLGGLILGNSHSEGGIFVIRKYNGDELYEVIEEFEGWEYILNPLASNKEKEYLTKINSEYYNSSELFTEFEIPSGIDIIDTRPIIENLKETNKLILLDEWSQFIINKRSTKKYLNIIDELNKKYSR